MNSLKSFCIVLGLLILAGPTFAQQKPSTNSANKKSCATEVTPEQYNEEMSRDREAYDRLLQEQLKGRPEGPGRDFVIQLHILRQDNGTNLISVPTVAQIRSEITNFVNPYFTSPTLAASFVECGPELYHNSTQYNYLSGDPEGDAMAALYNVPNVINIYFVEDADGACGWARFPSKLPVDYIVIDYACATNQSTLVHELGHYFDVYHTHETAFGSENVTRVVTDACYNASTTGDLLIDTDADPILSRPGITITAAPGCAVTAMPFMDNCTPPVTYTPDPTNIMSYSLKACRTIWSPLQEARMSAAMSGSRSYLLGNACNCCITDLVAGSQGLCSRNKYSQDVIVTYSFPPASGNLIVNGQSFPITSSPQTVTLTNLTSDGNTVNVTASFSADALCSYSETGLFTAASPCPAIANDDRNGDGIPDIADPCACDDPQNSIILNGPSAPHGDLLMHEVVTVSSFAGETWALTTLNSGSVLNPDGTPLVSYGMTEGPPGTYTIEFWHSAGVGYDALFSNGVNVLPMSNLCAACPTPVPTMGEWGLIFFILLLINGGLVALTANKRMPTIG